jgi:parallel beta-helix repeat protein
MRLMFRSLGVARTTLASLVLVAATVGAASAVPIPISSPGAILTQPGSYYLTQDLDCSGEPFGIQIVANNVRLDLKGRKLTGIGVLGILVNQCSNTYISNGTVMGFAAGIHLAAPDRVTIKNMTIRKNLVGIVGGKSNHTISFNLVADNGFDGIYLVGNNHHVCNNRVSRNGDESLLDDFLGISSEPEKGCEGSTAGIRIEGNNAKIVCNFLEKNKGFGISAEGHNHTIYNNTASYNCRSGIRLYGDDSTIMRNRSSNNDENGIRLSKGSDDNRIEDNVALKNDKLDIWDGNLPNACTNTYVNNLFETSNDLTGTCIQ